MLRNLVYYKLNKTRDIHKNLCNIVNIFYIFNSNVLNFNRFSYESTIPNLMSYLNYCVGPLYTDGIDNYDVKHHFPETMERPDK